LITREQISQHMNIVMAIYPIAMTHIVQIEKVKINSNFMFFILNMYVIGISNESFHSIVIRMKWCMCGIVCLPIHYPGYTKRNNLNYCVQVSCLTIRAPWKYVNKFSQYRIYVIMNFERGIIHINQYMFYVRFITALVNISGNNIPRTNLEIHAFLFRQKIVHWAMFSLNKGIGAE